MSTTTPTAPSSHSATNPENARIAEYDRPNLIKELAAIVGSEYVLSGAAEQRVYDCDAYTVDKSTPGAVVLPQTTEQVSQIVKLCNRLNIPFIPRGAGTGLSGGTTAICGGVVISTMKLNQILEIDPVNRRIRAQAGCVNMRLSKATAEHGLHYAPDPSSQGACTVGGNVAENSGGPHTLKYGVTTNHIVALTMVLPDGEIVHLGSETEDPVGYDLVGFVVGSEGTLGIVTEVVARLTPLPQSVRTLLAVFETIDDCTQTVSAIIASGIMPAALEMIDQTILLAIEEAFHFGFPQDAKAVLIIELDGIEAGLDEDTERVRQICMDEHAREVQVAKTAEDRARLWIARKKGIGAAGRLAPSIVTQDGVIPRSKLPEVLREVQAISEKYRIRICNIFHAGDGNLHPCVLFDERDPDELQRVKEAGEEILQLCVRVGGSVTGEHGIGVEKINAMPWLFSETDMDVMRRLRAVFNQNELCNPGKVLPTSKTCVEVRWKPKVAW
jgi:glycolate oxidase subunit GlcD